MDRDTKPEDLFVLLVTGDEWRRIKVRQLLARAGYQVQVACSQREALHALAHGVTPLRQDAAAIIVDQESLGPAALVIIRAVRIAELGIPVIVSSAFGAADNVIACLRAGAADYITWPPEPRQVLDTLARVLDTRATP